MRLSLILVTTLLATVPCDAQEHPDIRRGDAAYAALRPGDALVHYESVLRADAHAYDALWKASRSLADLAEYEQESSKRAEMYRQAEALARRAVELRPDDAEGHFHLARALGRVALSVGARERVKYGKEVHAHALEALRLSPDHPGALHVMGMWHAEVRRLPGIARFFAKTILGGDVFSSASWDEAVRYLSRAVEVDPGRIAHHLDLARIHRDMGARDQARMHYQHVLDGEATDFNDARYQSEARAELEQLARDE